MHCPNRDLGIPDLETILWTDGLVERIDPDLIHCNAFVGLPLLAVSRLRGIPLAQWLRLAEPGLLLDHLIAADLVTAVSHFVAREGAKHMLNAGKIHVIHDCVDTESFSPSAEPRRNVRAELGIESNQFIVLCIARFVPYKRHDVLIRAIALTAERYANVRLILVAERESGVQDSYEGVLTFIHQAGQKQRTTVLGFQEDVLSLELAADAVVLCSEGDPLGTVVLESLALGRTVIVSASGGLTEIVIDGVSGLHCVPGDPEHLASQICRLIESAELCRNLGKQARQRALEQFSMGAHSGRLVSMYKALVNSC